MVEDTSPQGAKRRFPNVGPPETEPPQKGTPHKHNRNTATRSSQSSPSFTIWGKMSFSLGNPVDGICKFGQAAAGKWLHPLLPRSAAKSGVRKRKGQGQGQGRHRRHPPDLGSRPTPLERAPLLTALGGHLSYVFLFLVGFVRELLWGTGPLGKGVRRIGEKHREGYAPLYAGFESFYIRNVYRRLKDAFNRPILSAPGGRVSLAGRSSDDHFWTWKLLGDEDNCSVTTEDTRTQEKQLDCINMASYNYLGFAESSGLCAEAAMAEVQDTGLSPGSSRLELGGLGIHKKLEEEVANFLGVEAALVFGMGFATNSLNIPRLLAGKETLVLSDEKNHASLILGLRLSGATVAVFRHNCPASLEKILRRRIIEGNPRTGRPYKRAVIMVEGVYSMEGTIACLPQIVAIKKKYKCYLYLDEAHSVGALGPRGRGAVDHYGLDPADVDVMMGTFTKSFGAAGGYIAGSRRLVDYLRIHSQAQSYATSMCAPVARQALTALRSLSADPTRALTLARNARYFRRRLRQTGCLVYGSENSPVVPVLLFAPAKIPALVNALLDRGVATVGVGFPATPMAEERARFCVSAAHTKEMLDEVLGIMEYLVDFISIKYSKRRPEESESEDEQSEVTY